MFFYPSIGIRAPVLRCKHLTVFRKDSGREKRFSKRWLVMNTHLHLALLSNTTEMVTIVILDHQYLMVKTLNTGKINWKVTFLVWMMIYGIFCWMVTNILLKLLV